MANEIVTIEGLEQLGERMRLLKVKVSTTIAARAVLAGAQVIKKLAKENAPEWPESHQLEGVVVPPGNLKNNIVVKKIKSPLAAEYIVTVRGKRKDFFAARYGRLVEFGTVKMRANPYMRKAFESGKDEAAFKIIQTLDEGISKVDGL